MDDVTTVQSPGLSEDQALERIIAFSRRFGSEHVDLAAHAAFPLVLTPDLLYRLWASFLPQIPWTTVADILLSPLCREVGYELYEMDPAIRNLLLRKLRQNPRFGQARFGDLAGFLEEYVQLNLNGDDPDERDLAEAQRLTALAHTAPGRAAGEIAGKLSDLSRLEGAELLRIATLTETLSKQLQDYSPLVQYARGVERLAHGDRKRASDLLERAFEGKPDLEIAGVTLQRPGPAPEVRQTRVEEEAAPPVSQEVGAPGTPQIFISYRRADSKYVVDRLRDRLIAAFGEEGLFRDLEDIPVGENFSELLDEAISTCDVLLVVIGPQWAGITDAQGRKRLFDSQDLTRIEIETGLAQPQVQVIPVLVSDARMPGPEDLPESLQGLLRRNALSLRNDPDFNNDVERLIQVISSLRVPIEVSTESFEPETIYIPAGTFVMGSPPGEGIPAHETPQHELSLPAYRIGMYPVTNAQYEVFVRETGRRVSPNMGWNGPRVPAGMENHLVTGVTFYEALAYCRWLSEKTGREYTLPNEAQWEKACRGGGNTTYPWGDEFDAGRCHAGQSSAAPVNSYPPQNEYDGFDFVGNVRQWTCTLWGENQTTPDPNYSYPWRDDGRNDLNASQQILRVVRGSSFRDDAQQARCSFRSGQFPDEGDAAGAGCGFRVVLTDLESQDVAPEFTGNVAGSRTRSSGTEQTTAAMRSKSERTSSIETPPAGVEIELQQRAAVLERLKREFQVDLVQDWGYSEGAWISGTWTLAELEKLYRVVALMVNTLGGSGRFAQFIGGVTVRKSDIGTHGGEALSHRVSLSTKGTFSAWTIVHEFAHAWDANYGWALSRELEKYTGGSTSPLRSAALRLTRNWDAGRNGSENKPGRRGRLPGCNRAGYFYGDKPSGSNWSFNRKEDFAESVAMYVGWERGNELSDWAKARIDRYVLEDGAKDENFGIENWKFYKKYFYPEGGDYTKTKRWQFIDDLVNGRLSVSRAR